MPLRGPTCKMVLARIQFRLNSKLDPSVAIFGNGFGCYSFWMLLLFKLYHLHLVAQFFRSFVHTVFAKLSQAPAPAQLSVSSKC